MKNVYRRAWLLAVLLMWGFASFAQGKLISGTVTSSDGSAMPGVNVLLKGSVNGTATDANGKYSISVTSDESVLVFSFIGHASQEVVVGSRAVVDVKMEEDVSQLGEVVVTALGIEREAKSLSYAQQTVSGSTLTEARDINILNSLSGRAAGVDIKKSSSGPGGSTKIVLRGNKSMSGDSQPLFVIDGIPMANNKGTQPGMWGGVDGGDGMSQINPDDIESMTVLRGSNAAALYGSQGANGVVVITTKKGKEGAAKVEFSSGVTFESVLKKPDLQFKYGAVGGAKESWSTTPGNYASNYVDDYFKTGSNFINSLAISGGSAKTTVYFSYGNVSASGISPHNTYNRNNVTFKQSTKLLNDKLTIRSSVMLSAEVSKNRMPSGYYLNPLTGLYMFPRERNFQDFKDNFQVFSEARNMDVQNWFVVDHHQSNPYWIVNREPRKDNTSRVIASLDLDYAINKDLSFSVRGNYDYADKTFDQRHSASSNSTNINPNGSWDYKKYNDKLIYTDAILKYNKKAGDFDFNIIAGGSYQKTDYGNGIAIDASAENGLLYPNEFFFQNLMPIVQVKSTQSSALIKEALFANATIGYKERLFLDIAGRNDWASSLAGTGNDSYFYPSVGLTGIISEMVALPTVISFAKVRASYTSVANEMPYNRINPGNTISAGGGVVRNTIRPFPDAKPEMLKSFELGANMRFLDDNIGFDVTYYNINSKDQFIKLPAPSGSGYTFYYVNAGEIVNKGIEVTVDATPVHTGNFTWKTAVNFSKNNNKVVETTPELKDPITTGESEGYYSRFQAGGSINDIYVYKYQRDTQGRIILGPDGKPLKTALVEYAGNLNPDWIAGWSNTLSYGNFGLTFMVNGKFGGKAFSQTESMLDGAGVSQRTADARDAGGVFINAVQNDVAVSKVDAETWFRAIGDRNGIGEAYVYDRTSVRLTQLALSYRFPIPSGKALKAATFSIVGQNLWLIYLKAPFDPELAMSTDQNSQSLDNFNLPATRTYGFNFKVTF
ncbi:SusC/RagA family TonB-linked outer membrane protein [Chryseolinea lacunae]|uniref:SusC/RagA family TonB-linked outer membrane protein n=1 Tax=Chryseolinea lacunae TaxID=2801331 RepID=A0ABS1KQU9_9BACT|nr:SusC/RagA family TonB-linked outer membrane protein [Chryseolinea lacunae]MBL0740661.1 SusC/RagA family TonB-linked outer membrane protein [Chryseolinea lacunae]